MIQTVVSLHELPVPEFILHRKEGLSVTKHHENMDPTGSGSWWYRLQMKYNPESSR